MKIALFLPNWVGDLVMATPALRALRRRFPRPARIAGILRPQLAELLCGSDWLDEQWHFDPRSDHCEWRSPALVGRLRQHRFDLAILLTNSLRSGLLAWLGGAKERVGYVRDLRGVLLTRKLYHPQDGYRLVPQPVVQTYLALAEAVGCPEERPQLELAVTPQERDLGERTWKNLGLRTDGRVVALNSSGAFGVSKHWPLEHCAALARRIAERLDHDVLVLCGPQERNGAREIVRRAASPRVFSLAEEQVGLSLTKACLERARMLVSTDSGPRHIAAALGKPTITLMGPTLPAWTENPTAHDRLVRVDLDCVGCGKRTCPLGHHRCMQDLLPERVFEEVARELEERPARAA